MFHMHAAFIITANRCFYHSVYLQVVEGQAKRAVQQLGAEHDMYVLDEKVSVMQQEQLQHAINAAAAGDDVLREMLLEQVSRTWWCVLLSTVDGAQGQLL
jgi:hypothetical protein